MIKKVLVLTVVFLLLMQGAAFALDGEIIFRDTLYGTAIGALVGLGIYAIDQNDLAQKVGGGVVAGAALGIIVGVVESRSMVSIEGDKVYVGLPSPIIEKRGEGTLYRADLLDVKF